MRFVCRILLAVCAATAVQMSPVKANEKNTLEQQARTAGAAAGLALAAAAESVTDSQAQVPPDYSSFRPPQRGETYNDPAYKTPITRLSDGQGQFNDSVHHEYATMSPFNKDNSRILLMTDSKGCYIVDLKGNVVVGPDDLSLSASAEPRWSMTDPNVFYFHQGNSLYEYNLQSRQKSLVKTFSEFRTISFGNGEADISEDGDRMLIVGDDREIGVYRFSTNTLGPTLNAKAGGGFDYADMTPNNNVLIRWHGVGRSRNQGIELYNERMEFIRQVTPFGAHADRGRDLNGDEILLIASYNDTEPPPGCEINGIEKVRLSDAKRTCLLGLPFTAEIHISANSAGKNPWVLVSVTDTGNGTASPQGNLPSNWAQMWRPYYNELILIRLDGSQVRRIAHHRSRTIGDYWWMPRAAISRDGSYAIFDSNFGQSPMRDYTDVFLADLRTTTASSSGSGAVLAGNVSAASYNGAALATEGLVAAFGLNLAEQTVAQSEQVPPTSLGGTTVLVRDSLGVERPAPLFYVSPSQINYQIPAQTALGVATVTIRNGRGETATGTARVSAVAPGLFTADTSGTGFAIGVVLRIRADGSQELEPLDYFDASQNRYVAIPIDLGSERDQVYLALFGTGIRYRSSLGSVIATIGGVPTEATYAGPQGAFPGLDQVNVRLPRSLAGRGEVIIELTVDGEPANPVRIVIK